MEGNSLSLSMAVLPANRNRKCAASNLPCPDMILTVNKNENNSLSFSNNDRHTFKYKIYVNVFLRFSRRCSKLGAASAFSMASTKSAWYHSMLY